MNMVRPPNQTFRHWWLEKDERFRVFCTERDRKVTVHRVDMASTVMPDGQLRTIWQMFTKESGRYQYSPYKTIQPRMADLPPEWVEAIRHGTDLEGVPA